MLLLIALQSLPSQARLCREKTHFWSAMLTPNMSNHEKSDIFKYVASGSLDIFDTKCGNLRALLQKHTEEHLRGKCLKRTVANCCCFFLCFFDHPPSLVCQGSSRTRMAKMKCSYLYQFVHNPQIPYSSKTCAAISKLGKPLNNSKTKLTLVLYMVSLGKFTLTLKRSQHHNEIKNIYIFFLNPALNEEMSEHMDSTTSLYE